MATGPSVRAFIAIPIGEDLRGYLGALVAPLVRLAGPAVGWVASEQFHLTLAFLGDLTSAQVNGSPGRPGLGAVAAEAARRFAPFDCAVAGTGFFPHAHRPRVLWMGVRPEEPLRCLGAAVRGGLAAAALPFDRRPFRAHLTMGRVRLPLSARCAAAWEELGQEMAVRSTSPGVPRLHVAEVVIYKSELRPVGPRYTVLARSPLEGR